MPNQHDNFLHQPAFARVSRQGDQLAELRCNLPVDLLLFLDAQVRALGMDGRTELVLEVLKEYANKKFHEASVLVNIVNGNPTVPEANRFGGAEE